MSKRSNSSEGSNKAPKLDTGRITKNKVFSETDEAKLEELLTATKGLINAPLIKEDPYFDALPITVSQIRTKLGSDKFRAIKKQITESNSPNQPQQQQQYIEF